MGICLISIAAPPFPPDGTIGDADRQHIAISYSGISAGAPVAPPPDEMFDSSIYESSMARDHFPRTGSSFGRSSFGFWLLNPEWRMAWQ